MISYTIKANKDDIADAISLFKFIGGNTSNAVRIGINKAAPIVKTAASTEIRSQVRLKAAYVRERLLITKATRSELSGAIRTPSRGILLSKYSTDPQLAQRVSWLKPPPEPSRGIRVKVKPSGSIKGLSNDYFYMVLPRSRALAIVRRRDEPGPQGGKIDVAYAPSLSQVFTTVKDDVAPVAQRVYTEKLLEAMNYILRKQYPPD